MKKLLSMLLVAGAFAVLTNDARAEYCDDYEVDNTTCGQCHSYVCYTSFFAFFFGYSWTSEGAWCDNGAGWTDQGCWYEGPYGAKKCPEWGGWSKCTWVGEEELPTYE